jgi:glycosyltransferase involved in cell wall biosynthesis
MPVGVETRIFEISTGTMRMSESILMFGRIAPVKRIDVLLKALVLLAERGTAFVANIYGNALSKDAAYLQSLISFVEEHQLSEYVHFYPGTPHRDAPAIFQAHELFVNLSPSGLYDKTIFEAAAAGALPITSNRDYLLEADPRLQASNDNPALLAEQLSYVLDLPVEEKERLRISSASLAIKHSLPQLIRALCLEL